jgi:hypothetical protein
MAAVCLFALSGLLGYLALMESVATANSPDEVLRVRVVSAEVVGGDARDSAILGNPWGFRVALILHSPAKSQNFQVETAPFLGSSWAAAMLRDRLLQAGEAEIYPDPDQPGAMRLRSATSGISVALPFLCAFFGVLCLACSLRYPAEPLPEPRASEPNQTHGVAPPSSGDTWSQLSR